jgi:hypothetical protein
MNRIENIKSKVETWEDEMVLNREDAEYLLQRLERYENGLKQAKDKSQIFASHIAYCKDRYYSIDPLDTFNKAQKIFEFLEEALKEDDNEIT